MRRRIIPLIALGLLVMAGTAATAKKSKKKNPKWPVGSELYVLRSAAGIDYHHAGIYIGNGEIIHVSAEPAGAAKDLFSGNSIVNVIRTPYEEFKGGGTVKIGPSKRKYKGKKVVKRALKELGKPWKYDPYGHNCQHFTSLMVSGKAVSPEAKKIGLAFGKVGEDLGMKAEGAGKDVTDAAKKLKFW